MEEVREIQSCERCSPIVLEGIKWPMLEILWRGLMVRP